MTLDREKIVAVSFLTAEEVQIVGQSLKRVYRVTDDGKFDDLLRQFEGPEQEPPPASRWRGRPW